MKTLSPIGLVSMFVLSACAAPASFSQGTGDPSAAEEATPARPSADPGADPSGGAPTETTPTTPTTPAVPEAEVVQKMASGSAHTCVLSSRGRIKCWGNNNYHQLGNTSAAESLTPIDGPVIDGEVIDLFAGMNHTCVLKKDRTVACWGGISYMMQADGVYGPAPDYGATVTSIAGLSDVLSVAIGRGHLCALTQGGDVYCWGNNSDGQLGDGTTTSSMTPVQVTGLPAKARSVHAGFDPVDLVYSHHVTCAALESGQSACWGSGGLRVDESSAVRALGVYSGGLMLAQLDDGTVGFTTTSMQLMTPVAGFSDVAELSVGNGFGCARRADKTVRCWGRNGQGQLGQGAPSPNFEETALTVPGLSGVVAISSHFSGYYTCALDDHHEVHCWGFNYYGELGTGDKIAQPSPVRVNVSF